MVIRLPKNSPFVTSLMLHAAILILLLFFVLVDFFKPEKSVHVFEMVSLQESAVPETTAPPQPRPKEETQPVAKPEAREMIHIADFRKNNPPPKPRPVQAPNRPPIIVPALKVPEVEISQTQTPSRQLSPQQSNALANYSARLRSRINAAWKKPANLGGLSLKLKAVFRVSPTGVVSQIRFSPGSGNVAFDDSVLAALRAVGNAGATPTGQAHTFSMTFGQD